MARPTRYNRAIANKICARVALGDSMRTIAKDPNYPGMTTLFRWLGEHEEFQKQYARAKEECADLYAEETIDIADNQVSQPLIGDDGLPVMVKGKMVMIRDAVSVNHARLRVDARKWYASKLRPKKYGDRVDIGNAEDKPFRTQSTWELLPVASPKREHD